VRQRENKMVAGGAAELCHGKNRPNSQSASTANSGGLPELLSRTRLKLSCDAVTVNA
jgi:hypothetical protein